ncbi:MAG: universal stress protein [Cephaloticoccus sp.]|nr:universal stress protein [Cephaloticoccus sp.]MCF7759241.1 universal stress protein [Cephaloticoccus sp.]
MTRIFCPTNFTVASHVAFQHALSLALAYRSKLTIMHVPTAAADESGKFPGVRAVLENWGKLPANSTETDVTALGLTVEKIKGRSGDPVDIVLHYLEHHPAELVVLSTHQKEGHARWLGRNIAEPLARRSQAMTLFVPNGKAGFISPENGCLHLRHILVPICAQPSPQRAVDAVVGLLTTCGVTDAVITLFYVGAEPDMPAVAAPVSDSNLTFAKIAHDGDPVEQITGAADRLGADLVVMSTAGHNGFLDALRGSTTEQVLRKLSCPLLAVPVKLAEGD